MHFRQELTDAINKALMTAFNLEVDSQSLLERPRDASHGDYACSVALKLSKELGKPPREIAEIMLNNLQGLEHFEHPEIAGPGFINFKIKDTSLVAFLAELFSSQADYTKLLSVIPSERPVIWEYSGPNIAKPMGVHHLLTTIIGQSLSNLYRYLGYNVVSINYIGDWGTQFGKLIYALKNWGDSEVIEHDPIEELLKLYVEFHEKAEQDPTLVDKGREELQKLEAGDVENTKLFTEIVELSLKGLEKTYSLLGGVSFDLIRGESPVVGLAKKIVEEQLADGNLKQGDEGAIIAEFAEEDLPSTVIRRGDGATVYLTRDVATIKERVEKWHPQAIYYVVDVAQKLHFAQVFALANRFNYLPSDGSVKAEHISFGRMQFADKKMSTRKGNIIRLDEVLEEAISRAQSILKEREVDVDPTEFSKLSHTIGVGGVKYNILSQNRTTNITFDWDKIISFEGNSAAYLQYVYARAQKVFEMGQKDSKIDFSGAVLDEPDRDLIRTLVRFPEVLELAAKENKTHYIAEYLFQLGQTYNSLYAQVAILDAEEKSSKLRIVLSKMTAETIKIGLKILAGIEVAERM